MVLYACPEWLVNIDHVGKGSNCDDLSRNMPGVNCRAAVVFHAWAIGGGSFYLPDNVGIDIGGDEIDTIKYVLLDTHYDNPTNKEGIIDSSGLKIWYTPTLREYSAGVLQLGLTLETPMNLWPPISQFIPPGIERAVDYAYCFSDCLEDGLNGNESVYAFANMLHSHLLGREMVLRHIRNGKELRPLDMNVAYDFNYQQMIPFTEHTEILPGDELILECVYDSTERNSTTYNGPTTEDEMCLSYLMVYPKPILGTCVSLYPALPNNGEWVGDVSAFFEQAEINGYYDPDIDFYDVNVDGALEFYQQFVNEGNRLQLCGDNQGLPLPANFGVYPSLRPDIDYDAFNDDDYYVCNVEDDIRTTEDDESSNQDHFISIFNLFVIPCVLFIL